MGENYTQESVKTEEGNNDFPGRSHPALFFHFALVASVLAFQQGLKICKKTRNCLLT